MLPVNLDRSDIIARSNSHGIAVAAGPSVPADGATGYAPGCAFFKLSCATPRSDGVFLNCGTQLSAAFKACSMAANGEPFAVNGALFSGFGSTQTIAADDTILVPAEGYIKIITTGGATGVILEAGSPGQEITIVNLGGDPMTFAASGTSHVADGANVSIGAFRKMGFTYVGTLWYAGAPAA